MFIFCWLLTTNCCAQVVPNAARESLLNLRNSERLSRREPSSGSHSKTTQLNHLKRSLIRIKIVSIRVARQFARRSVANFADANLDCSHFECSCLGSARLKWLPLRAAASKRPEQKEQLGGAKDASWPADAGEEICLLFWCKVAVEPLN